MNKLITILFLVFFLQLGFGQKWVQKSSFPASGRHGAFGFSVGNKGYVGTGHINSGTITDLYFSDLWEYDPGTDSWTQKADVPILDVAYGTAFGLGEYGYVGYQLDFNRFSPVSNTYTQLTAPPIFMGYDVNTTLNGEAQIYSGSIIYYYNPTQDSWQKVTADASSPAPYVPIILSDSIYALTYNTSNLNLSFSKWNENTLFWDHISDYPDSIYTSHLTGFSLNGLAYFLMGSYGSNNSGKTCWEFNLDSMSWRKITSFKGEKRRYYAQFQIENRGYIATGTSGINYNDLWEFVPLDTTKTPAKPILLPAPYIGKEYPYPNPSADYIYFDIGENLDSAEHSMVLINCQGQIVDQLNSTGQQMIIDCSRYEAGVYFFRIYTGPISLKSGKIEIL